FVMRVTGTATSPPIPSVETFTPTPTPNLELPAVSAALSVSDLSAAKPKQLAATKTATAMKPVFFKTFTSLKRVCKRLRLYVPAFVKELRSRYGYPPARTRGDHSPKWMQFELKT